MKPKPTLAVIEGPSGQLQLRVFDATSLSSKTDPSMCVIVSHPHSLYGGTMDNKVVTTIERFYQNQACSTVVYNFRGVGASEGHYDQGEGEQADLQAVVNWARTELSFEKLVLAGFSFGAYVTLKVQPVVQANQLLIVAPPVGLYNFNALPEVDVPWNMIIGLQDEVVDSKEMVAWAMNLQNKPSLYGRAQASHFFHGQLIWLKQVLGALIV